MKLKDDLISRQALCEYALNQKDKSITPNDIMRFPSAQPETHEERTETHACDLISRQAAIEALQEHRNLFCDNTPETFSKLSYAEKSRVDELDMAIATLINLPSTQPEMIREIRKWINSGNRGNADYFIVDKIEEIINKYE